MRPFYRNKKRCGSLEKTRSRWGWLFIAPWILGISVFFVLPMAETFVYSFSKLSVGTGGFEKNFVGFENYLYFFTKDTYFWSYLGSSLVSSIPQVLIIVTYSTLIALVLKSDFPGRGFARAIFFFPVIIASGAVMNILKTQVMMTESATEVTNSYMFKAPDLNEYFASLGLPEAVLNSITDIVNQVFDLTWKSGVQILLMLAAVNNIPSGFYEAAEMEGATAWEKFWKVTLPTVSPTVLVVVIYSLIDGFMDYGNKVMQLLSSYYTSNNYSYSATIGVVYSICTLLTVGIAYKLLSGRIFYS